MVSSGIVAKLTMVNHMVKMVAFATMVNISYVMRFTMVDQYGIMVNYITMVNVQCGQLSTMVDYGIPWLTILLTMINFSTMVNKL